MMFKAVFRSHCGNEHVVEIPDGWSVMEGARQNGVDGVVAECGGGMICGTCHVIVDEEWYAKTGEREMSEEALLEVVPEASATSRLSCQIIMEPRLDGIVVQVPSEQLDF